MSEQQSDNAFEENVLDIKQQSDGSTFNISFQLNIPGGDLGKLADTAAVLCGTLNELSSKLGVTPVTKH